MSDRRSPPRLRADCNANSDRSIRESAAQPAVHLAPRVRTNRGIGNDTLGRTLFGRSHQRRWIEMQQQDLVEARLLANNLVHGVHRPCQERWPAARNILG